MLVLTRKTGQSLCIGDSVRVTVVEMGGGTVRLAIDAPEDVAIYRQEVLDRIAGANREAAEAGRQLESSQRHAEGSH